jgi:hypothetical protein
VDYGVKYFTLFSFVLLTFSAYSQNNEEATVTIIGNAIDNNYANQFNPVQNSVPPPPEQQQFAPINQNIEPSLENGFHMRFQIESPGSAERMSSVNSSSVSYSGSGSGGGMKVKKRSISLSEKSFNIKKKLKNKIPKRKKKYHPTLCEKFR